MRLTTLFGILSTLAAFAGGVKFETNAQRLARGLPPLPPRSPRTGVSAAKNSKPSGSPAACNLRTTDLCCNSTGHSDDPEFSIVLALLGLVVSTDVLIGLTCSPLVAVGSCARIPVCCINNEFNGIIALGCSPIKN